MLRNLVVTGIVSVVMGLTTLALRPVTPAAEESRMDGQPARWEVALDEEAASPMDPQASPQDSLGDAQAGQSPEADSASSQTADGMMGGGQAASGMMMCPCMQMMMGGGTGGGMMGGQMSQSNATSQPLSNPRTLEQARERAEQYLESSGNPNLKIGEINETAASFEIEVVTRDDSLVNWLIIDKKSGELKAQY